VPNRLPRRRCRSRAIRITPRAGTHVVSRRERWRAPNLSPQWAHQQRNDKNSSHVFKTSFVQLRVLGRVGVPATTKKPPAFANGYRYLLERELQRPKLSLSFSFVLNPIRDVSCVIVLQSSIRRDCRPRLLHHALRGRRGIDLPTPCSSSAPFRNRRVSVTLLKRLRRGWLCRFGVDAVAHDVLLLGSVGMCVELIQLMWGQSPKPALSEAEKAVHASVARNLVYARPNP
jgi:hypothetical protein